MAAGKITSNRHRNGPRHRRHRSCPRYGHGWKRARSYASRATISSDIRRKSPMVRVLQHQDRRPIAILSGSRRASKFWLTTVPHAPKSSRRTNPKKPDGPIATCRRPRHLLSPKAQAQGNDGPASEAVAGERGTGAERDEFADRKRPVHRRHAAIGAGIEPLAKTRRPLDRRGNLLWCLDALAGDVNDPEQDLLALQKAEQVDRHLGAGYIEACRTIVRRPTWTATATPVSRLARRRERYSSSTRSWLSETQAAR